nr:MAG TPA: hypothetical protein [Caudoviricetes sp.]
MFEFVQSHPIRILLSTFQRKSDTKKINHTLLLQLNNHLC